MSTNLIGRTTAIVLLGAIAVGVGFLVWPRGPGPGQVDADGRLEIVMEDYRFAADTWTVPAGEPVTFTFINRDEVSHPLTFGAELVEADQRPAGYARDLFAGLQPRVTPAAAVLAPEPPNTAFTVQVPGGETVTLEVVLPDDRRGTWSVGCFLGAGCHYEAGLAATLTVE